MSYRLGIDTGGTYTDAVLVDAQQKVIATFKSLTTRQDLAVGIGKAISGLPSELLEEVQLVALSTTLTTNSVVEGRGAEVCALLVGYNENQLKKSGLTEIVAKGGAFLLSGGHDADGNEKHVLDESAARDAILKLKDSVSAFAISSMFATRNSAHELKLRALVEELSGKPVACGHELASSLGAPQRALTAVLNARMIPYIQQLIESVKGILASLEISAPLMIVKGDGSLVNTLTAQQQPVATVLSGPAASVIGACALSGLENAIVADMGGTTTDIAVVTNGQPKLSAEGAQIGDWQPMVEAVKVYCIGLGGDSEIHMSAASGLKIGPRRVVPLSLLASEHPWIITRLNQQLNAYPNARHNKFVVRMESDETLLQQLNEKEHQAWQLLLEGPVELDEIAEKDKEIARAMGKLQRMGLAIYTGFTPTDAAHVLGLSNHLNTEAANLAAKIWSSQMRCLYGLGKWKNGDAIGPSEEVHQLVTKRISNTLIEASLSDSDKLSQARASKLTELLTQLILSSDNTTADSLFNLEFNADYPLVAVGGPASSYYPSVAKALGVELHLPEHAEVANAVGAVMGSVVQRAQVTISQPTAGIYHIYNKEAPLRFASIDDAFSKAEQMVGEQATAQAKAAGASDIEISLTRIENHVKHEIDGDLFLDCVVQATATGRPSYQSV